MGLIFCLFFFFVISYKTYFLILKKIVYDQLIYVFFYINYNLNLLLCDVQGAGC